MVVHDKTKIFGDELESDLVQVNSVLIDVFQSLARNFFCQVYVSTGCCCCV